MSVSPCTERNRNYYLVCEVLLPNEEPFLSGTSLYPTVSMTITLRFWELIGVVTVNIFSSVNQILLIYVWSGNLCTRRWHDIRRFFLSWSLKPWVRNLFETGSFHSFLIITGTLHWWISVNLAISLRDKCVPCCSSRLNRFAFDLIGILCRYMGFGPSTTFILGRWFCLVTFLNHAFKTTFCPVRFTWKVIIFLAPYSFSTHKILVSVKSSWEKPGIG